MINKNIILKFLSKLCVCCVKPRMLDLWSLSAGLESNLWLLSFPTRATSLCTFSFDETIQKPSSVFHLSSVLASATAYNLFLKKLSTLDESLIRYGMRARRKIKLFFPIKSRVCESQSVLMSFNQRSQVICYVVKALSRVDKAFMLEGSGHSSFGFGRSSGFEDSRPGRYMVVSMRCKSWRQNLFDNKCYKSWRWLWSLDLNKNTKWFVHARVWTTYILILFLWLIVLSVFGCARHGLDHCQSQTKE